MWKLKMRGSRVFSLIAHIDVVGTSLLERSMKHSSLLLLNFTQSVSWWTGIQDARIAPAL